MFQTIKGLTMKASKGIGSNLIAVTLMYFLTAIVVALSSPSEYLAWRFYFLEWDAPTQATLERSEQFRAGMWIILAPVLVKYFVQGVLAPFSLVVQHARRCKGNTFTLQSKDAPRVSVIIPAWNEEVGIVKTIKSVLHTDYPNLQVIIVNDGSTDQTHEMISDFIANYVEENNVTIKYLKNLNGGKARAMNSALPHVDGEFVVTVDADSAMDAKAIEKMVECFDDPMVGGVAGNVIVANRSAPMGWMQQMEYVSGFYFKRADSLLGAVYIIGGAAAAYRKDILDQAGVFDHSVITEDIEMSTRILAMGYKTRYAHDAVVYTEGPSDLRGLCNQRLRWKYGRIQTFLKHRQLFFNFKHGNQYLTSFLLPLVVYSEFLLMFEPITLPLFFADSFITHSNCSIVDIIMVLAFLTIFQVALDKKLGFHSNLIPLAPITWAVVYSIDLVEMQALYRSLWRLATGNELKWQKWDRVGIPDDACTETGVKNK